MHIEHLRMICFQVSVEFFLVRKNFLAPRAGQPLVYGVFNNNVAFNIGKTFSGAVATNTACPGEILWSTVVSDFYQQVEHTWNTDA